MNNTEIFELCENSSKHQCLDCNANWEMGIICCSCGRNMNSTRSPKEFYQNNREVTSIPGSVNKKNSCRGAKHGPSERQKMCSHAKQLPKKARQEKHGSHPTILSRWYADEEYRSSLSDIGRREHHIILYDRIALEKHMYIATRVERQKFETLDSYGKCRRRNSAITQSTTRLCSSEKRMQTIARRTFGKDPRRTQNHSSQSTNKTAKTTTV